MADITMPKLSDTMTEGTLVSWKKQKGDKVSSGDVIAEVETDKATMEMEAFEDGVLAEIYVREGTKVAVGEKIAAITGKGEAAPAATAPTAKTAPALAAAPTKAAVPSESAPAVASSNEIAEAASVANATDAEHGSAPAADGKNGGSTHDSGRVKASPLAKKVALAQGISLGGLTGLRSRRPHHPARRAGGFLRCGVVRRRPVRSPPPRQQPPRPLPRLRLRLRRKAPAFRRRRSGCR